MAKGRSSASKAHAPKGVGRTVGKSVGAWGEREAGILAVARDLFLRDGYENTSMAAVATAAGLSEGTLYNYFRNKTDLVIRVTLDNLEMRVAAATRAVDEAASLREGLERLIDLHLCSRVGVEDIYRIWLREVRGVKSYRRSSGRDALSRFANQFPRLLKKFGQEEKAGSPSHAMMRDLVFGGSEHIGFTAIVQRRVDKIDVAATASRLADIYLRGFGLA